MRESTLTEREQEILRLLAEGLSDREIGDRLYLTVGTVKWYNRQIFSKLHARNRTHAIEEARRSGLLGPTPAHAVEAARTRPALPAPVTSFVGRGREVQEITHALGAARLVTLTGAPGTGKTRLALEVAARLSQSFADGVWFVSLAPLSDPGLVPSEICRVLGLQEAGSHSHAALLAGHTRDKRLLLVLDNCEHLLPAAPLLADLLANAPGLRVLATSRELLRLYGEQEYRVPPLQLPEGEKAPDPEALLACESAALFVQRAQAASPDFALDASNAASVAIICIQLDGLPLAIELAAARIRFYSPQSLLLRLGSRLETLNRGPRDLPRRQQTLRSTLAWSYDRLEPDEQRLFARLGVFAGGCTLEDAAAVCGEGLSMPAAEGIESLAEKSLLRLEQRQGDEPRVAMLETMREYAHELMAQSGELDTLRGRHALRFLSLVQAAAGNLRGRDSAFWLRRLEQEHDNLRASLQWSLGADTSGQTGLRLLGALGHFWEIKGYYSEAYTWFNRILQLPGAAEPTRERTNALVAFGGVAYMRGDYATAQRLFEEVLAFAQGADDALTVLLTLVSLGEIASEVGDYDTTLALFRQAHALAQETGHEPTMARAATQLGFGALRAGDLSEALRSLEQGRAHYEAYGDDLGVALALSGLGELALREQRMEDATSLLEESLAIRRSLGQRWGIAASLGSLAWVAMRQEEWARAEDLLFESLSIRREIGDPGGLAWCLEKLAEMARLRAESGHAGSDHAGPERAGPERAGSERAVRIYAAAAALRAVLNSVIDPSDAAAYAATMARLRATLGDRFEALWEEGSRMSPDQAIACALPGRAL